MALAFSRDDVEPLARIGPHARRALRLEARLCRLRQETRALLKALDLVDSASFLLAAGGRLIHMNTRARRIVDSADGLRFDRGRLVACHPATRSALETLLASVSGRVVVPRPSRPWPYVAEASAVEGVPSTQTWTLLFVRDPIPEVTDDCLAPVAALYGLTPAETRLVARLVAGDTLREAATALHISWETSRTYLKHILGKTRTRRQAELVVLFVRLAARP